MTDNELAALRKANMEAVVALEAAGLSIDRAMLRTHALLEFLLGPDLPAAEEHFERRLEEAVVGARKDLARMKLQSLR